MLCLCLLYLHFLCFMFTFDRKVFNKKGIYTEDSSEKNLYWKIFSEDPLPRLLHGNAVHWAQGRSSALYLGIGLNHRQGEARTVLWALPICQKSSPTKGWLISSWAALTSFWMFKLFQKLEYQEKKEISCLDLKLPEYSVCTTDSVVPGLLATRALPA